MLDWAVNSTHEVRILVNFSISIFLCASPVTTFFLGVDALFTLLCGINYGNSRARDVGPICISFTAIAL